MEKPEDFTETGEIFKKSMHDALAHLDAVTEEARKAHEKAIDEQIAAREEFKRIQDDAHRISEEYIDKHRKEFEERLRNEILLKITKNMIMDGHLPPQIYKWLQIPNQMMADAWFELGFEKLGQHVAHIGYESQGRAGNVILYREDRVVKFAYEFAGGLALAIIYIPTLEKWVETTGFALEERDEILNFIGKRVLRDQAAGYNYYIEKDAIIITLEKRT